MHFTGLEIYVAVGWLICLTMVLVILRRQFAPGASLAWLGIVFLHPYVGLILYLAIGETRLGPNRSERHRELVKRYRNAQANELRELVAAGVSPQVSPTAVFHDAADPQISPLYEPIVRQAEKISGMAVLKGNHAEFINDAPEFVRRLTTDIDAARTEAHLLYYIFACDETGCQIVDALERAAKRGVKCRVLVDAVASREMFRRHGLSRRLKKAGVQLATALPVALLRRRVPRMDLRNHRKTAIIDRRIGYVGSHNLVNPDYGGQRGNPWVDVTSRLTGPVVGELSAVFAEDWAFETGEQLPLNAMDFKGGPEQTTTASESETPIAMQAVPTGPSDPSESFRKILLTALQCARQRVLLTTPYFVPDETTLTALIMAADRGVEVTLVLPLVPDHLFTAAAGRAHFRRLLENGITIYLYKKGMLHAKTTTVDDAFGIVASANLDVRSFNLNFELAVIMYGSAITERLRKVQMEFVRDSQLLEKARWLQRSGWKQYSDNAISLLSPLL